MPLIRAYFLLGYRTTAIFPVDRRTGSTAGQFPLASIAVDLTSGQNGFFDDQDMRLGEDDSSDPMFDLTEGRIHVVFALEPLSDVTGWLRDQTPQNQHTNLGYDVPLAAAHKRVTLAEDQIGLDAFHTAADALMSQLFAFLRPLWQNSNTQGDGFGLVRQNHGGMLWIFDPDHWESQRIEFYQLKIFEHPKRLLRPLMFWPDDEVTNGRFADQFLLEQIYDLSSQGRNYFDGRDTPIDTNAEAISIQEFARRARGDSGPSARTPPSFQYYAYNPSFIPLTQAETSVTSRDVRVRPKRFWKQLESSVSQAKFAHVWSFDRWRAIKAGTPSESWMDSILSLAWDGVFAIPDAVEPRVPLEPMEIVKKNVGQPNEKWDIYLHQEKLITLVIPPRSVFGAQPDQHDLTHDDYDFLPQSPLTLDKKVAVEFRRGTDRSRPTLFIVASRGVSITTHQFARPKRRLDEGMRVYFRRVFKDYNAQHPWDLNITRVQDDGLVPRQGVAIDPEKILAPSSINPSRVKEIDPLPGTDPNAPAEREHEIELEFRYQPDTWNWFDSTRGIEIIPHAWGEEIIYPSLAVTNSSDTISDEDAKLIELRAATSMRIGLCVNPFSGHNGYTYDLCLERYQYNGWTVINLHAIVVTTTPCIKDNIFDQSIRPCSRGVELATNLSSDQTYSELIGSAVGLESPPPQGDHPNYYAFGSGNLGDVTAEYWAIPEHKLFDLPAPLSVRLPVTFPSSERVTNWYNASVPALRISRAELHPLRMPTGIGEGWAEINGVNLPIRRYEYNEWNEPYLDEIIAFVLDVVISSTGVVGQMADAAEFVYAAIYGTDKWGRPVSKFDLALMGACVLIPFVTSRMLRTGEGVADAALDAAPRLRSKSSGSARTSFVDDFLFPFRGLIQEAADGQPGASAALTYQVGNYLDEVGVGGRKITGSSHWTRADDFARALTDQSSKIPNFIAGLTPDDPRNFLAIEDIIQVIKDKDGKEHASFIFGPLHTQFQLARREDATLTPLRFLREKAVGIAKQIGKTVLGPRAMGMRVKGPSRVFSATFNARAPRMTGATKALSSINGTELRLAVKKYLIDATSDVEPLLMVHASDGFVAGAADAHRLNLLTTVKSIAQDLGYDLSDPNRITDDHPILLLFDELIAEGGNAHRHLHDMLRGGRNSDKSLPVDEVGARVGESLILGLDRLINFEGVRKLRGDTAALPDLGRRFTLDEIDGDAVRGPMRRMIGDWVNAGGKAYEHALTTELRDGFDLKRAVHQFNQNSGPSGWRLDVEFQPRLVSIDGQNTQLGADAIVYAVRGSRRVAIEVQSKAFASLVNVIGTTGHSVALSAFPRVVRSAVYLEGSFNILPTFKVVGGSSILNQFVKQQLRLAVFRGVYPPGSAIRRGNVPTALPNDVSEWSEMAADQIFVVNSEHFIGSMIARIQARIPSSELGQVSLTQINKLGRADREVLAKMYPNAANAGWENVTIDLSDAGQIRVKFDQQSTAIAQEMGNMAQGMIAMDNGFQAALRELSGTGAGPIPSPQGLRVVFSNDRNLLDEITAALAQVDQ